MWPWSRQSFRIEILRRDALVYREGERSIALQRDLLVDSDFDYVVYLERAKDWDTPGGPVPLSELDRKRIRENIQTNEGERVRIDWH